MLFAEVCFIPLL